MSPISLIPVIVLVHLLISVGSFPFVPILLPAAAAAVALYSRPPSSQFLIHVCCWTHFLPILLQPLLSLIQSLPSSTAFTFPHSVLSFLIHFSTLALFSLLQSPSCLPIHLTQGWVKQKQPEKKTQNPNRDDTLRWFYF